VSAKNNMNITELFQVIIREVRKYKVEQIEFERQEILNKEMEKAKKGKNYKSMRFPALESMEKHSCILDLIIV
jgi:hypothetical protein